MEKVTKIAAFRISDSQLANLMYAALYTGAQITSAMHNDLRKYNRAQVSRWWVRIVVEIHHDRVAEFEAIAGVSLSDNHAVQLN